MKSSPISKSPTLKSKLNKKRSSKEVLDSCVHFKMEKRSFNKRNSNNPVLLQQMTFKTDKNIST